MHVWLLIRSAMDQQWKSLWIWTIFSNAENWLTIDCAIDCYYYQIIWLIIFIIEDYCFNDNVLRTNPFYDNVIDVIHSVFLTLKMAERNCFLASHARLVDCLVLFLFVYWFHVFAIICDLHSLAFTRRPVAAFFLISILTHRWIINHISNTYLL